MHKSYRAMLVLFLGEQPNNMLNNSHIAKISISEHVWKIKRLNKDRMFIIGMH